MFLQPDDLAPLQIWYLYKSLLANRDIKFIPVAATKPKTIEINLEKYKIKALIALQNGKSSQRREQLRLRALELKLKEEELRLKEMEMNKVNYLTNIEEEKLECFRDINASLKE